MPGRIVGFFRNLLCRNRVERAFDDELQSSVELLTEDKMNERLSRSEARLTIRRGMVPPFGSRGFHHLRHDLGCLASIPLLRP
jgi:hypothetical protein